MHHYDNPYYADNVYGHVVALLESSVGRRPGAVHVDIGCGFGRIAEPLTQATGVAYMGFDMDDEAIASLRSRGFEAHQLDLRRPTDEIVHHLQALLAGRPLASISIVDVLEHIAEPAPLLAALREIAAASTAPIVISVPNFAHRDVGFKLAFGRLDTREVGILDHTHVHTFTDRGLRGFLMEHGLHVVARNDVIREKSDQHFPSTHPALSPATLLGSALRTLRGGVDDTSTVNQLVAACLPGPRSPAEHTQTESALREQAPFLTVVTRTQGKRHTTLRDVLLALAAQSCDDFELVVVGHRLDRDAQLLVERLIEDTPLHLRQRIRLLRVERGNRTAPLNEGFAAARGQYIAILDDDDMPMAHWVETFKELADKSPGCVLRAVAVKQECDEIQPAFSRQPVPLTVSGFKTEYPSRFEWLEHLRVNQTPPIALAFPRTAFQDLNIRFDESLTTTEDWDFLMRTAAVCGVASSPAITCIYRWWKGAESSRSVHSQDEWRVNHEKIWDKIDRHPTLLAPGTTRQLRALMDYADKLQERLFQFKAELDRAGRTVDMSDLVHVDSGARAELRALLSSTSWRVSAPLRHASRILRGGPKTKPLVPESMPQTAAEEAVRSIRTSTSWKVTAPLRRLRNLF